MQLVMREGVFVVAIPSKLESLLDGIRALLALVTAAIIRRAVGWHGQGGLRAESHRSSGSAA